MNGNGPAHGLFVGLATIDLEYAVEAFPEANAKIQAKSQDVYVGGPATNAAIVFAHLGGEAALATAVGRHALAGVVRADLDRYGVQLVDLNAEFDGLPAISSVMVDRTGQRTVISANAARIGVIRTAVDAELCAWADVVEVDGHQMKACVQWAQAAQAQGKPVIFDGGSWKQGTEELLRYVGIAICSADFLPPGCANENETVLYLRSKGVRQIAITHGGGPVRYANGAEVGEIELPSVAVVDTLGAGDIFHGAFCWTWVEGLKFHDALAEAAWVASHSCRFHGTREWMKRPAFKPAGISKRVSRRAGNQAPSLFSRP